MSIKKARRKAGFSLSYQDSNLDKQSQNLLCYHYTIAQCDPKVSKNCNFGKGL